ncbi:assimilatory sulfite reductase [Clavulina sp. PMI_390]|nr:assimilatory sulfite reductase [Clavulina sp. PMI_390]
MSASEAIETLAWDASKCIYAYDLALQQGVGIHAKTWKAAGRNGPQVIEMETRTGAGLAITGRMSEGTSSEAASGFTLSVFTTPAGLAEMMPALAGLPSSEVCASTRAIIQVPAVTTVEPSLSLSPSLAGLSSVLPIVPEQLAIVVSGGAQEAVDIAAASYSVTTSHVAHIFDHYSSARELSKLTKRAAAQPKQSNSIEQALSQAGYALFDYSGSKSATDVIVVVNGVFASNVKEAVKNDASVGVITVRLLRPWDSTKFLEALPASAQRIHVLDDVASAYVDGPVYQDVLSTLFEQPGRRPVVRSVRVTAEDLASYVASPSALKAALATHVPSVAKAAVAASSAKKIAFWTGSSLSALPQQLAQSFLATSAIQTRLLSNSDAFAKPGGITLARLLLAPATNPVVAPIDSVLPLQGGVSGSDLIVVADASLLSSHDILSGAAPQSAVLVLTSQAADEVVAGAHASTLDIIRQRSLHVYLFDAERDAKESDLHLARAQIAFLRLYIGGEASIEVFERVVRAIVGSNVLGTAVDKLVRAVWDGLHSIAIPAATTEVTKKGEEPAPLKPFQFNAVSLTGFAELVAGSVRNGPVSAPWHVAAKHLLFPEAYGTEPPASPLEPPTITALRPDMPIETFLVTCSVNQRLTPTSYNRNVFHMEFDTAGTGLTYKLGEALGVHGWNDENDVLDFCKWYGVNPDLVISVPLPATAGGTGAAAGRRKVTRTVFQTLQQQIDLFGRPPKSFFAALATYATSKREQLALRFVAAPEGASQLKKYGEKDTVNYADVLALYPSARPSIEELAVIVEEIKERHYSIASAQSFVGDRVDLLVVAVDWVTPSGKFGIGARSHCIFPDVLYLGTPKYGQCTRYLANLKVGSKVTVSIKPSVMKAPPSELQPIIMAGLGTGAAPFRAFMQHRSLLKSQGNEVGPMIYYFGSRHRSQEYLYGEEIEAYVKDGILTHVGLAFSRDSDSKVYIQHKMMQDGKHLAGMLGNDDGKPEHEGVFYLCGPTWPVPDVHAALVDALTNYAGKTVESATEFIEQLKEDERYVLEVY